MLVPGLEITNAHAPVTPSLADIASWMSPLPTLELNAADQCRRAEVEAYIRGKFQHSYGAEIVHFLPELLSLRCAGLLTGAAGITFAGKHPHLFLEHYLDAPIEVELKNLGLRDTGRAGIVEIGNLVATSRGASRIVFIVLASVLHRLDMRWLVFTATGPLFASLQKLGLSLQRIRAADIDRLPPSGHNNWGTYYEQRPEVVAASLDSAMTLITDRKLFHTIQQLFGKQIDELALELAQRLDG